MRLFIVDGIKYQRIGDEDYYAQELFETEELHGYLSKNMLESQKSVFTCVVYDSDVEAEFARSLPTVEKSGTVVLAEHRDIQAPEFAGAYTVKVFEGEGKHLSDGTLQYTRVILRPDSGAPQFGPIVLEGPEDGERSPGRKRRLMRYSPYSPD